MVEDEYLRRQHAALCDSQTSQMTRRVSTPVYRRWSDIDSLVSIKHAHVTVLQSYMWKQSTSKGCERRTTPEYTELVIHVNTTRVTFCSGRIDVIDCFSLGI